MANSVTKTKVLSIYKQLLRESQKFEAYNFRNYALRRVKDAFKENKTLKEPDAIQKQYQFASENLESIRRQVVIGKLFSSDRLVIENQSDSK